MVRTRTDGANDLIRFRSRENEDEVLWWLLHNLQQRVKALVSNHVGLVDDEDAVAGIRWRVISALTQLTHIFHGVMRCRIQDRKSTRLNSSHVSISYAVFCLNNKS